MKGVQRAAVFKNMPRFPCVIACMVVGARTTFLHAHLLMDQQ